MIKAMIVPLLALHLAAGCDTKCWTSWNGERVCTAQCPRNAHVRVAGSPLLRRGGEENPGPRCCNSWQYCQCHRAT